MVARLDNVISVTLRQKPLFTAPVVNLILSSKLFLKLFLPQLMVLYFFLSFSISDILYGPTDPSSTVS
jgi:hypothetical protein